MASCRELIRELEPHVRLFRDPRNGLAWVEDGRSGCGHSAHPNIDRTGSVRGMIALGYWKKGDRIVRSHGFIYNTSSRVVTDALDQIAEQHCHCGGLHSRERSQ